MHKSHIIFVPKIVYFKKNCTFSLFPLNCVILKDLDFVAVFFREKKMVFLSYPADDILEFSFKGNFVLFSILSADFWKSIQQTFISCLSCLYLCTYFTVSRVDTYILSRRRIHGKLSDKLRSKTYLFWPFSSTFN